MKNIFTTKKALLFALLEDAVFLLFLLALITSGVEILLPGSISAKIPIALIFSVLGLGLVLLAAVAKKENLPLKTLLLPRALAGSAFLGIVFLAVVFTLPFGLASALFQIGLIALVLFVLVKKG